MAPTAPAPESSADHKALTLLLLLTLIWGLNWPVMKLGVSGTPAHPDPYPPLTFRALSMVFGLPLFGGVLLAMGVPLKVRRDQWLPLVRLALTNMVIWQIIIIVALQSLSSGRAAILGYSMPIFAALWGWAAFGERLGPRQLLGVAAAGLGIVLLLANEFTRLAGSPLAALAMIFAAAVWAWGTHQLRRSTIALPLLTIVFWMSAIALVVVSASALLFERADWRWPSAATGWAIAYNAVGVFCFANAAWFYLARRLSPVASSISVMMIPVLGTFSGALALGEGLHWQDFAAMVLMVAAIASVLITPRDRGH